MLEIEQVATDIILETMRKAELDPSTYAVMFHVNKDNRLSFCFTDDIFYAKSYNGLLIVDQTGEMSVVVESGNHNGRPGIIIKEKQ
jgi:hypothetical protein